MLDSAKFILSKGKLLEQYRKVKQVSDTVSYSVKTNPEIAGVLEKETDCLFSVHTLRTAESVEDKSRIIFFAQAWDRKEIEKLFSLGISRFVVDNRKDLEELLFFLKAGKEKITLFLRMRMKEYTVATGKHFVFGMFSQEINELIPKLNKNKSIERLGVHFHRKTQNINEWNLKDILEKSLSDKTLSSIQLLDIGGGIPVEYHNSKAEKLYSNIFVRIEELRKLMNGKGIKMIAEPGRFLAGPPVKLEAAVKNVYGNTVIVNCSVYNSAMDTFIAHVRLKVEGEGEGEVFTIKGKTPDSMDILRYKVKMKKPAIGDKIVFLNAGAYNFSTEFCNVEKLKTEVVE